MPIHYNTAVIKSLSDFWRFKGDAIPSEVNDVIQPTFDVRPPATISRSAQASNTAAEQTIYTTPTDVDFFLSSACLSLIKDVTATSTATNLFATIDGVQRQILVIVGITLTVQNQTVAISYDTPIKVDRGTNITLKHSAATANVNAQATIQGFLA